MATIDISVTAVNDAPVIEGQSLNSDEDNTLAITLFAESLFGDWLLSPPLEDEVPHDSSSMDTSVTERRRVIEAPRCRLVSHTVATTRHAHNTRMTLADPPIGGYMLGR